MQLAIFGCGGMGREAADCARRTGRYESLVFVTDTGGAPVDGLPHLHWQELDNDCPIIVAIGDPAARRAVATRIDRDWHSVFALSSITSSFSSIGPGAILAEQSIVNNGARIGRHFIGNVFSQVSHDTIIGDFVTFSPHVSCNGWVEIGDDVFVGAGAVIRNGTPARRLRIGYGAIIAAGAIVVKDVAAGEVVMGEPSRARSGGR